MIRQDSLNPEVLLEAFAAELAAAAYGVALHTRTQDAWIDLELEIWKALASKLKTWSQRNCRDADPRE